MWLFVLIGMLLIRFFFFFQAEDGIRDLYVTGVQTCALPISDEAGDPAEALEARPAPLDRQADEVVPGLAGGGREVHGSAALARGDPAERDPDHEAIDAL